MSDDHSRDGGFESLGPAKEPAKGTSDVKQVAAFEQLLGRAASDTERIQIYQVAHHLGIPPDDGIWSVILALQYHLVLYKELPTEILEAIEAGITKSLGLGQSAIVKAKDQAIKEIHQAARDAANAEIQEYRKGAARAIQHLANKVAEQTRHSPWAYIWGALGALALLLAGAILHVVITGRL